MVQKNPQRNLVRRVSLKGFFIFMTMLSFKQVESNYGKKEPCERGYSWVIKFSRCLIFLFFQFVLKIAANAARTKKKIGVVNKC